MDILDVLVEMKNFLDVKIAEENAVNEVYKNKLDKSRKEMTDEIISDLKRVYDYSCKLGIYYWVVAVTDLDIANLYKSNVKYKQQQLDFTFNSDGLYLRQYCETESGYLDAAQIYSKGKWFYPEYCEAFYANKDMLIDLFEQSVVNRFFQMKSSEIENIGMTREKLLGQIKNMQTIIKGE